MPALTVSPPTALFEDNSYCGETLSPCPSLDSKDTCKTVCERYPQYFFSRDVESICGRRFDANPTYGVIEQRREICGEQCDTSNTLWGSRKGLIDEVQVSLDDSAPSSTSLEAFPLRFCLNAVMGSDGQPTGDCTYTVATGTGLTHGSFSLRIDWSGTVTAVHDFALRFKVEGPTVTTCVSMSVHSGVVLFSRGYAQVSMDQRTSSQRAFVMETTCWFPAHNVDSRAVRPSQMVVTVDFEAAK